MRLKQIWAVVPVPSKGKLLWSRITFSKITLIYFAFSLLHCIIQIFFQVQAFSINAQAAGFLWKLITQADAKDPGFAVMSGDELRFCETVPADFSTDTCELIWRAAGLDTTTSESSSGSQSSPIPQAQSATGTVSQGTLSTGSASLSGSTGSTLTFALAVSPSVTGASRAAASDSDDENSLATATSTISLVASTSTAISAAKHSVNGATHDVESDSDDDDDDDAASVSSDEDDSHDELAVRGLIAREHTGSFSVATVEINGTAEVVIDGFGFNHETVLLSRRCLYTLNWPVEELNNTKREDIAFIAFQLWVLGMSIVALLNESIPHIIASLLTHVLATAWAAFQVVDTKDFQTRFNRMTTNNACDGVNLLAHYWTGRANVEIPSLALNAAALLVSAFLSFKLFKLFGWQTFKRVGASRTINRMYKLVLSLSIAIQLSLFFIVVSVGLWIDSLCTGQIGRLSDRPMLYRGVMIGVFLLLIPWLITGWIAVRRELRIPMMIFLILSFGYLGGWGAMFASPTFRWTFVLWRFFSVMTTASVLLTLLTFVLGLWCRINFGKGLPRYLNAEEPLPDEFVPVPYGSKTTADAEKVDFPSGRGALPTFSAAFGKDTPPSQMKFGTSRLGPRFSTPSLEPFETPTEGRSVQSSFSAAPSSRNEMPEVPPLPYIGNQHSRSGSVSSQSSYGSYKSSGSTSSSRSGRGSNKQLNPFSKKWAIE